MKFKKQAPHRSYRASAQAVSRTYKRWVRLEQGTREMYLKFIARVVERHDYALANLVGWASR